MGMIIWEVSKKAMQITDEKKTKRYCTLLRKNNSFEVLNESSIQLYKFVTHDKQVLNAWDVVQLDNGKIVIIGSIVCMWWSTYFYLWEGMFTDNEFSDFTEKSFSDVDIPVKDGEFFGTYMEKMNDGTRKRHIFNIDDYISCILM